MLKSEFKYYFLLGISVLFSLNIYAQDESDITQIIEALMQNNQDESYDFDTYFEHFNELKNHPIDLNNASVYDLESSQLFTDQQINALLKHIEINGKLISIYELQAIPFFEIDFIQNILPFVKVKGNIDDFNIKFGKLLSKGTHQVFLRYQQKFPKTEGYKNGNYLGNPSKIYLRYRYNYSNRLSYGITAEKDAGEPMFKDKNKLGFDFYSFHFFWRKNTKWRAIALGDYQINMGQGLVLWSGFGFNKSVNTAMVKKQGSTLKPFTSVNEYLFMRGAAFTYQFKDFLLTPFVSFKNIDGNINYTDTLENEIESNRIQLAGYHRTATEMQSKNALQELKTGFNFQYFKRDKHIGLNYVSTYFTKPIAFEQKLYNKYQFQGNLLQNVSIDYHYLIKSFHFFGEEALSFSKNEVGYAFLNGVMFNPSKFADISIVHRYYAPQYQTVNYTNAFGESTAPNNEHGIYFGTQLKPFSKITLSAYYDFYKFPWLKYRADKPSRGQDILFQLKYKHNRNFEIYCTYKWETKEENTKIELDKNDRLLVTQQNKNYLQNYFGANAFQFNELNQEYLSYNSYISKSAIEAATFITPKTTQRLRLNISYQLTKNWNINTRAEMSFYNDKINKKQTGYLVYQSITYSNFMFPLSFSARIALFDIPKYDARIYAYENDVLYQFTIPAFYKTGIRTYLNLQYKVTKNIQVWLRLANTYYSKENSMGAGNEQINSKNVFELKAQMRLKF